MKITFNKIAGLFLIVLAGSIAANAQQGVRKISRIRTIEYKGDLAHLLANLAESYKTVIGFETDLKKPLSQVSISLAEVDLPDILNGVVQSQPSYQWRENNGAIAVTPVNKRSSLIDTTVESFEVVDVTGEEAIDRLLSLPEVQANLRSLSLSRRPSEALRGTISEKKFSLNLKGVNMREILTRIAAESGMYFWIFRTFPDGSFWLGTSTR